MPCEAELPMAPTPNVETLKRDLTHRFPAELQTLSIGKHTFSIYCVSDNEALLDRLIDAPADSLEVLDERLPYWSSLWPSSIALSEALLANPPFGTGARVLELGCGLGLCTLGAMLTGATVTATDYQPDALLFTRLNCLSNLDTEPNVQLLDWRDPPEGVGYVSIIASDLAYESRFFDPLLDCFDQLLEPEGQIFLSEPNRAIAKPFFERLQATGWRQEVISDSPSATVYRVTRFP